MKRIGLLTSGGDCQALNATMRGIVKGICNYYEEVEIYGFEEGYKGLIYGNYRLLGPKDFSGILTKGGTIIGSSRAPFKEMRIPDKNGLDKVEAMKQNYHKLRLDCLVILGGNGTQKSANLLREEGLNVIHMPKTIDNDIWTTAASHGRVFIVEVMGHKVGQLTLHAGIAGGADIILLPEIPYDIDKVCKAIEKRNKNKKGFTILAVAEGAIPKERAKMSKKELKKFMETYKYPAVSYEIADELTKRLGSEVRVTVPGHTQRGGSPCPYDRVLSTRLGAACAQSIIDEEFGVMIGIVNNETKRIPLEESAGKLKYVDPESQIIKEAKLIGISFGD